MQSLSHPHARRLDHHADRDVASTSFADSDTFPVRFAASAAFASQLKACGKSQFLLDGMVLHARICRLFDAQDTFLGNCVIEMYGDCGSLDDAASAFRCIKNPNLHSWNILMNAFAKNNHNKRAMEVYHDMQLHGFSPNAYTFVCALNASSPSLPDVQRIHADVIEHGCIGQVVVCTTLVNVYGRSGDLYEAKAIFRDIFKKDVISWNAVLAACNRNGSFHDALTLFHLMLEDGMKPNDVTFVCALDACASLGLLEDGKDIHEAIKHSDDTQTLFIGNALLHMYGKCGSLVDAKDVFYQMPKHDVISWTTMIAACVQNGCSEEGLFYFYKMQHDGVKPNSVTFLSAIDACANRASLEDGKRIHKIITRSQYSKELNVLNALISMYGKCGTSADAKEVFDQVDNPNVVTWNAMISVYVQNGQNQMALNVFRQMLQLSIDPDEITFSCVLNACTSLMDLEQGKRVHDAIVASQYAEDFVVGTALVNMYGKCEDLHNARMVFNQMPHKDVALWSAIVTACASNGHSEDALDLFREMHTNNLLPDSTAYVAALNACSNTCASEDGLRIHAELLCIGYENELQVGTALVDMYGKCGAIDSARHVFVRMTHWDVVAWNTMIAACAQNGYGNVAISLLHGMQRHGVKPDRISFASLLSACNHMGMVNDGKRLFASMTREYGIAPCAEHYLYMIDLLGRAGRIEDAVALIDTMPFEKNGTLWQTFLNACNIHGKTEQGTETARYLFPMNSDKAAPYILLSNLYGTGMEPTV